VSPSEDTCSRRSIAGVQWRERAAVAVLCGERVDVCRIRPAMDRRRTRVYVPQAMGWGRDGFAVQFSCSWQR
jgi:hypothetical protein